MIPTTEQLLCTTLGFDLSTATAVQRARCRIGDGLPLAELAEHPDVITMLGGPEALQALPPEQPDTVVDLSSIRSAKTMMAVCRAARAVFVVNTSSLRIGEVPRIALFSLKLSRARIAFRMLAALFSRPALRPLVINETADAITVRSPSGVPVEIVCAAGGRAAQDFIGDWLAGVIADEAPRMVGREDGIVNLDDVLTAIRGRLLPGAQVQLIGSPWSPHGPVYDLVQTHWQKPSQHVVVLRSTGPQNNPSHFTPELVAEMQERDPIAFQTSVAADFADPETGLLNPIAVKRNTRETPLEIPRVYGAKYLAGMDQSDGQPGGNAWTLVIVRKQGVGMGVWRYQVVLAREWRSGGPSAILQECAKLCEKYRVHTVLADGYSGAANCDLARRWGLNLIPQRSSPAENLDRFTNLATLIHTDQLELPPDRQFRRDLLSIKKKTTRDGYSIYLPRTADGRHCDYAPALVSALAAQAHTVDREGLERRAEQIMAVATGEAQSWQQWPDSAWNDV